MGNWGLSWRLKRQWVYREGFAEEGTSLGVSTKTMEGICLACHRLVVCSEKKDFSAYSIRCFCSICKELLKCILLVGTGDDTETFLLDFWRTWIFQIWCYHILVFDGPDDFTERRIMESCRLGPYRGRQLLLEAWKSLQNKLFWKGKIKIIPHALQGKTRRYLKRKILSFFNY